MKKSPRSLAALKGWNTRRANAAIRSQRARKGWETRRANIRAIETRNRLRRAKRRKRAIVETKREEIPKSVSRSEYAVSADYKARKRGSSVTVQISAIGPANATKADVQSATNEKINTGRSPHGWRISIIDWKGKRANQTTAGAWKAFSAPLSLANLSIHKVGKT